jgi:hypothetical protein
MRPSQLVTQCITCASVATRRSLAGICSSGCTFCLDYCRSDSRQASISQCAVLMHRSKWERHGGARANESQARVGHMRQPWSGAISCIQMAKACPRWLPGRGNLQTGRRGGVWRGGLGAICWSECNGGARGGVHSKVKGVWCTSWGGCVNSVECQACSDIRRVSRQVCLESPCMEISRL